MIKTYTEKDATNLSVLGVHIDTLEKEIEYLNSGQANIPRLTRRTVISYLSQRMVQIAEYQQELQQAKKIIAEAEVEPQHEENYS
tara:strand:+ start:394 stop:648 length:255 start_codon:yes stop_codon:yes gene_type:complete